MPVQEGGIGDTPHSPSRNFPDSTGITEEPGKKDPLALINASPGALALKALQQTLQMLEE